MDRSKVASSRHSARESAYLAVLSSFKGETYAKDFLDHWREDERPDSRDYRLAQEIAYGTIRMASSLDYLALKLSSKNKLSLKLKEKALLRTALYQYYYMKQVPLYAIANETAQIAKKYCHSFFEKFLNASLRAVTKYPLSFPEGNSVKDLAIRYSYPEYFVQELIKNCGLNLSKEIMTACNEKAPLMYRIRDTAELGVAQLLNFDFLDSIVNNPLYYIQNITPAYLMWNLCNKLHNKNPKKILDLCSSPGGKLIAVHDFLKAGKLYANDVSEHKLKKIKQNCSKYTIDAHLTAISGENYPTSEKFDLVIIDAPCSNSGVLNKRPEARWRMSLQQDAQLQAIQQALLQHAVELIHEGGEIWYLTCSFLKNENEDITHWASEKFGLDIGYQESILPNSYGWDGGYACQLKLPPQSHRGGS